MSAMVASQPAFGTQEALPAEKMSRSSCASMNIKRSMVSLTLLFTMCIHTSVHDHVAGQVYTSRLSGQKPI